MRACPLIFTSEIQHCVKHRPMQSTVYLITCPLGLRYVGGTRGKLKDRLSKHRSERSGCRLIRDAIHRHGWENMQISILMCCPVGSLNQNESLYIEALDTVHPRGYNLRCGSKAGAPSPRGTELSTLVLDPTEATGEMRKAVEEDLEDITGTRPPPMTWSGPVSVSIADLNRMHNASMYLPWAGPVKGIPVHGTPQGFDVNEFFNSEADWQCFKSMCAASKSRFEECCMSTSGLTKAENDKNLEQARLLNAQKMARDDIDVATQMARDDIDANNAINKMKHDIENLKMKAMACEELGLHEEAKLLKRKIVDI